MLFGSSQNENGMAWRFFQRFQESVESGLRQHVNLVDDVNAVMPDLRGNANLVSQITDVVNRVIRSGVEFMDIVGAIAIERFARFALIAGFNLGAQILTVDGFGKNTGTGCFPYPTRSAKQIGVRKLAVFNCIFQRRGNRGLSNNGLKSIGSVFSG
jgi:hypothetical protein